MGEDDRAETGGRGAPDPRSATAAERPAPDPAADPAAAFAGWTAAAMAPASAMLFALDMTRRAQGRALDLAGFGPRRAPSRKVAEGRLWRLHRYDGPRGGPPALILPAPIKRAYVWDLSPCLSPVRAALARGFDLHLLEWRDPARGDRETGLEAYAVAALDEALAALAAARPAGAAPPAVLAHSLGGTFAAIHAALGRESMARAVLLGAPLHFGAEGFGAALSRRLPGGRELLPDGAAAPGSGLSLAAVSASPAGFLWSRLQEAGRAAARPRDIDALMRVERWALEEAPLSARLVREVLERLYREDALTRGDLALEAGLAGPGRVRIPLLGVSDLGDPVAPPEAMAPFLDAVPEGRGRLISYPGESGVGLPHLAVLIGRRAAQELWPRALDWAAGAD